MIFLVLALIVAATALHGYCVLAEKSGYRRDPRFKWHPELKGLRLGDRLLVFHPPKEADAEEDAPD